VSHKLKETHDQGIQKTGAKECQEENKPQGKSTEIQKAERESCKIPNMKTKKSCKLGIRVESEGNMARQKGGQEGK